MSNREYKQIIKAFVVDFFTGKITEEVFREKIAALVTKKPLSVTEIDGFVIEAKMAIARLKGKGLL